MPHLVQSWLEAFGALGLSIGGGLLGSWFARRPTPWWMIGYFIPLIVIVLYGIGMHAPSLAATPPFSWLLTGRTKFAIIGLLAALVLTTPLSRIPRRPARILILVMLALLVWRMSVWPFLAPAFNHKYLRSLVTTIDEDGICRQSNGYNCGPAAAVTALRQLGLPAEEGDIAILAHTSSAIGTPPDMLAAALQQHYGDDGLVAEYRAFQTVAELRDAGLTLVVIKYSFMLDHYVAVLEVTGTEVIAGDPLNGLTRYSLADFEQMWRFHGVLLAMDDEHEPEP